MNILICSAGRRVSLVRYFKQALQSLCKGGQVFTTDLEPGLAPACVASDEGFKIGRFSESTYVSDLLELCLSNNVKLVIPTIDTELILLAENSELFATNGVTVLVSDLDLVRSCTDKRLTAKLFSDYGVANPRKIDPNDPCFPAFVKPVEGSSSKDLHLLHSKKDIKNALLDEGRYVWMEYCDPLDYHEVTIDLYYDKGSSLKCVVPRRRLEVRAGEVSKGVATKDEQMIQFVTDKLTTLKGARGCITLQVFAHREAPNYYGIEINPRFGGGYPLSYLAGANFPEWIIREYMLGENIEPYDGWEDGLLLLRYDAELTVGGYQY